MITQMQFVDVWGYENWIYSLCMQLVLTWWSVKLDCLLNFLGIQDDMHLDFYFYSFGKLLGMGMFYIMRLCILLVMSVEESKSLWSTFTVYVKSFFSVPQMPGHLHWQWYWTNPCIAIDTSNVPCESRAFSHFAFICISLHSYRWGCRERQNAQNLPGNFMRTWWVLFICNTIRN